jgi:phosphocarrier protein HPr
MNVPAAPRNEECGPEAFREGAIVRKLTICNRKGLHARASAKFVQTVEKFDADVRVMRSGESVGGTSITVEATGREAAAVVDALTDLVNSRFGEDD